MTTFLYSALDAQGRRTSGSIPADNRAAALDEVLRRGLHPVDVQEDSPHAASWNIAAEHRARRVPQKVVEAFTRELANLLGAGVPLSRALHLLRREASHPAARAQWSEIHDDVIGGMSLADALAKWPRTFSGVYAAMVRAGETGGFLEVVLSQIADFRLREQDLLGRVKAALVYPAVLAVLATGVLIFLMVFFIPKFSDIFADFGSDLPALTRVVVGASHLVMHYGLFVLGGIALALLALRRWLATEGGRRAAERAMLATPGLGPVLARFALVRFARMLGTLIGAGVPLVSALRVAREAIGNQTLADAVSHAIEEVRRGTPLSRSLAETPQLFPASVVEMIAVSEETSRMDKELLRLAGTYESELDRQLRMLVSVAEPTLLIVMAGLIGTVVVAMLLPLLTLQDLIK